jgi:hypothetical protein
MLQLKDRRWLRCPSLPAGAHWREDGTFATDADALSRESPLCDAMTATAFLVAAVASATFV